MKKSLSLCLVALCSVLIFSCGGSSGGGGGNTAQAPATPAGGGNVTPAVTAGLLFPQAVQGSGQMTNNCPVGRGLFDLGATGIVKTSWMPSLGNRFYDYVDFFILAMEGDPAYWNNRLNLTQDPLNRVVKIIDFLDSSNVEKRYEGYFQSGSSKIIFRERGTYEARGDEENPQQYGVNMSFPSGSFYMNAAEFGYVFNPQTNYFDQGFVEYCYSADPKDLSLVKNKLRYRLFEKPNLIGRASEGIEQREIEKFFVNAASWEFSSTDPGLLNQLSAAMSLMLLSTMGVLSNIPVTEGVFTYIFDLDSKMRPVGTFKVGAKDAGGTLYPIDQADFLWTLFRNQTTNEVDVELMYGAWANQVLSSLWPPSEELYSIRTLPANAAQRAQFSVSDSPGGSVRETFYKK